MAEVGGVEFMMELEAKFDEATKMIREMTKVEAEAARVDAALRKAGKSTSLFQDAIGKTGGAFKSLGASFLSTAAALATVEGVKSVGRFFMDMTSDALQAAGEAERLRRSFEGLMGVAPADELLGFMDRLANKTEFTDGALKGFASSLVRAGYSGEQFDRALAATLDLAAMSQDKMAGAAEAIGLLSKIQLKGGISERELVGAKIDVAGFYKRVAADTGIGIKEVEKQIQAGKVSVSVLREALYAEITKKTGKDLGGLGLSMSDTYLAQLEKTKDIIPNLFEELERTGGLEKISDGLGRLVEGFAPGSPAGTKIVNGLTDMINRFGDLVSAIDFDVWAGRISRAMDLFSGLVEVGAAVAGEIGMLFDKFSLFGEALGESLYETVEYVGKFFDAAWNIGAAVWQGLKDSLANGVKFVTEGVSNLGSAITDKFKSILGIRSPSQVFANFGLMTAAGFEMGITRALPGVAATVASAFSPSALMPPVSEAPGVGALAVERGAARLPGAGASAPASTFEAHITVNIGAVPGGEGAAKEVADQAALGVRRALEAIFVQWAAEGGAT